VKKKAKRGATEADPAQVIEPYRPCPYIDKTDHNKDTGRRKSMRTDKVEAAAPSVEVEHKKPKRDQGEVRTRRVGKHTAQELLHKSEYRIVDQSDDRQGHNNR